LGEQVPLDPTFRDEAGNMVRFADYLGQKPLILTLNYYECPMLCPLVLDGPLRALRALPFTIGDQFNLATVSIDPGETTAHAVAKKAHYVWGYGRDGAAAGWHFLTGEETSIRQLTQAVGFRSEMGRCRDF
jgi:protein SCO1